jgi:hypothetical protein
MTVKKSTVVEIIGWYGALAVALAYALVSFDLIRSDGVTFQLLNLTGALGLLVISAWKNVKPSVLLNSFWALVAAVSLVRLLMN